MCTAGGMRRRSTIATAALGIAALQCIVPNSVLFTGPCTWRGTRPSIASRAAEESEGKAEASDADLEFFLKKEALKRGLDSSAVGDFAEERKEFKDIKVGDVLIFGPIEGVKDDSLEDRWRMAANTVWNFDREVPVVLITKHESGATEGILLTRRTGVLMGDFVNAFQNRPLQWGGPKGTSNRILMVHPYSEVPDCEPVGMTGLYKGSNVLKAHEWLRDESNAASSLRFRFFIDFVRWDQGSLEEEVQGRVWLPMHVSRDLILSEEFDRDGKPLYEAIAELATDETKAAVAAWRSRL
mmetsp:Transcript_44500/g.81281  ORF Transcript_44500/g.81281 Transcript_44500/m.81281 type:complete len:297 (+) Transcript_44500:44-934(+)